MPQSQMLEATGNIELLVSSLLRGDSPASIRANLAADFGIHGGLSVVDYVDHELSEFAARRYWFGDHGFSIVPVSFADGVLRFFVVDANGSLVYEDALGVDRNGRVAGNCQPVEVVTKLKFKSGGEMKRSAALRYPKGSIVTARLDCAGSCVLRGPEFADDNFWQIEADFEGDDFLERQIGIRSVVERNGMRSVVVAEALFRGTDHPMFADMRPTISGSEILIPEGRLRVWSLAVLLMDGSRRYIEHGITPVMQFDQPVAKVILTDALDNEWEQEAKAFLVKGD
jgi:hypothetical protein